jgi:hypothetical protein
LVTRDWDFVVFVGLVVSGAAWVWLHIALLVYVLRDRRLGLGWRCAALLPPATPLVGFHAGALTLTGLWCVFGAVYLVLRTAL